MGTNMSTEHATSAFALDYAHCRTPFYPEDGHVMPLPNCDISLQNYMASELRIAKS